MFVCLNLEKFEKFEKLEKFKFKFRKKKIKKGEREFFGIYF